MFESMKKRAGDAYSSIFGSESTPNEANLHGGESGLRAAEKNKDTFTDMKVDKEGGKYYDNKKDIDEGIEENKKLNDMRSSAKTGL